MAAPILRCIPLRAEKAYEKATGGKAADKEQ